MSSNTSKVDWSFYKKNGFTPIVNVSGTMTSIGASIMIDDAQLAMQSISPHFIKIHELQSSASKIISELTGAESGFITASAGAGITLSIAAVMTGKDPGLIEKLPNTEGLKTEVLVQSGHLCNYGGTVDQAIRLSGATTVSFGQSTQVQDHQLYNAISESAAAGLYVVSHHVVEYGQMSFDCFCRICHEKGIPVIVDAASEYDLKIFIEKGADIVIYSSHKFLGGPTAGIVAGKSDLIQACYMQNIGLGRLMKVGKESVFGAMSALKAWKKRDHEAIREIETNALNLWQQSAIGFNGVQANIVGDPTNNPLSRLKVSINKYIFKSSAASVAQALSRCETPIIVRDHEIELGYFQLDPCNLADGHAEIVASNLHNVLKSASINPLSEVDLDEHRNSSIQGYLDWK